MRVVVGIAVATGVCAATACQLVAGIGDIDLADDGGADAAGSDVMSADHAAGDSTPPGDAGRDHDAGADALPPSTACALDGGRCIASGDSVGGEVCRNAALMPCGQTGGPCCPASPGAMASAADFCAAGDVCVAGQCAACGSPGQPCCPDVGPTTDGCGQLGCCDFTGGALGVCVAASSMCPNGGSCSFSFMGQGCLCFGIGGQCQKGDLGCGTQGANCCGADCASGLQCSNGTCVRCGAAGEPCCGPSGAAGACGAGLVCTSMATCAACGAIGQPCCLGGACTQGACDPKSDTCSAAAGCGGCGAPGQACCAGGTCASEVCDAGRCP